jgi:hypothetical protein
MHTYAKYCSKPCKSKAKHTQERLKKLSSRLRCCKVCNKEFTAFNAQQIYCSPKCRNIYNVENIKNWHIKHIDRYKERKKVYGEKPENRQHKREMHKKNNDALRQESILEGVYKTLYTPEEDNYILTHYKQLTKKELAGALSRTIASVQSRYIKIHQKM